MQPFSSDVATTCDYCGWLDWTVEKYGRVTHKQGCPHRTDPWHQGDPHPEEREPSAASHRVCGSAVRWDTERRRWWCGTCDTQVFPRQIIEADYIRWLQARAWELEAQLDAERGVPEGGPEYERPA